MAIGQRQKVTRYRLYDCRMAVFIVKNQYDMTVSPLQIFNITVSLFFLSHFNTSTVLLTYDLHHGKFKKFCLILSKSPVQFKCFIICMFVFCFFLQNRTQTKNQGLICVYMYICYTFLSLTFSLFSIAQRLLNKSWPSLYYVSEYTLC